LNRHLGWHLWELTGEGLLELRWRLELRRESEVILLHMRHLGKHREGVRETHLWLAHVETVMSRGLLRLIFLIFFLLGVPDTKLLHRFRGFSGALRRLYFHNRLHWPPRSLSVELLGLLSLSYVRIQSMHALEHLNRVYLWLSEWILSDRLHHLEHLLLHMRRHRSHRVCHHSLNLRELWFDWDLLLQYRSIDRR